ncbi:uncharacterized protein LOC111011968 [Momordica charantia]|uniref:Uncharacterized protein LOC111011968 n=1 Tax=Momordica charantia TaxID=3673 RepID=A0A6J1CIR3_MOMCH|nr:uncharacterized protein LOC111011968 [Momordica charantia]
MGPAFVTVYKAHTENWAGALQARVQHVPQAWAQREPQAPPQLTLQDPAQHEVQAGPQRHLQFLFLRGELQLQHQLLLQLTHQHRQKHQRRRQAAAQYRRHHRTAGDRPLTIRRRRRRPMPQLSPFPLTSACLFFSPFSLHSDHCDALFQKPSPPYF